MFAYGRRAYHTARKIVEQNEQIYYRKRASKSAALACSDHLFCVAVLTLLQRHAKAFSTQRRFYGPGHFEHGNRARDCLARVESFGSVCPNIRQETFENEIAADRGFVDGPLRTGDRRHPNATRAS